MSHLLRVLSLPFLLLQPLSAFEVSAPESRQALPAEVLKQWRTQVLSKLVESDIPQARVERIYQILAQGERDFLHMDFDSAWNRAQELVWKLEQLPPSPVVAQFWDRAFALLLMSAKELEILDERLRRRAQAFRSAPLFLSMLSQSLTTELFSTKEAQAKPELSGVFVFGSQQRACPSECFVQAFDFESEKLRADWWNIEDPLSAESLTQSQALKDQRRLSQSFIRDLLESTRPKDWREEKLEIRWNRKWSLQLEALRRKNPPPTEIFLPPVAAEIQAIPALEENPRSRETKFFESPWFWAIAGGLAIGAGVTAYELSRPKKVRVRTP